jgi:hypothetical protein
VFERRGVAFGHGTGMAGKFFFLSLVIVNTKLTLPVGSNDR